MSEPLDEESLRGRLRRAEAEAVRLSTERARIRALLGASPRSRRRAAGLVGALVLGVGFAASITLEMTRGARQRRVEEVRFEDLEARTAECLRSELELMLALEQCEARHPSFHMNPRRAPPCKCEAGDPLCSCL